jgi:hypothetical protein
MDKFVVGVACEILRVKIEERDKKWGECDRG